MRRRRMLIVAAVWVLLMAGVVFPARTDAGLITIGVANPDTYSVVHDGALTVGRPGVLGNDLNVDLLGGTTVQLVAGVSHGSLSLDNDGGFRYVPDPRYVGTDTFQYKLAGLLTTPATVTLHVTNTAPVARPDSYTVTGRQTLTVSAPGVLANDTEADGDALTVIVVDDGGISGSISLSSNGRLVYSPGGGFKGGETISYRVSDGISTSAVTTVTLLRATSTPSPSPSPTPAPTVAPTPRPTLRPAPTLPLPTVPPSVLPVPLPTLPPLAPRSSPGSRSTPVPSSGGFTPTPSDTPEPTSSPSQPAGAVASGSPREGSAAPPTGISGGQAAPRSTGGPGGLVLRSVDSETGDGLRIDGLMGLNVGQLWFVPAAAIGGPGLLVLLWVALQVAAGLVWLPAARRLRGDERGDAIVRA